MFPGTVLTYINFFEKGASPGSCDHQKFWTLNANSSKMVNSYGLQI